MQFHLFQTLFDGIITPVLATMQAMLAPISTVMQPVALVGVSIWLLFATWDVMSRSRNMVQIGRQAFQVVMFYSLVWAAAYTQYIVNFFLHALPDTLSAALGGNGQPTALLDQLCQEAFRKAAEVYQAIPAYSFKGAILSIGVILFIVAALCCVAFVFVTTATSAVIVVLTLVVGPVFMAAATVPWTRRFTSGWLAVLVGSAITQLLGLALIRMMVGTSAILLRQFATAAQDTNANSIVMLMGLAQIGVLLWLFKKTMERVPELGQIIGGGVYHGTNAAFTAISAGSTAGATFLGAVTGGVGGAVAGARTTGTASGAVIAAVSGAASGAGRAASRGFRYSAPAGRSLSRRMR